MHAVTWGKSANLSEYFEPPLDADFRDVFRLAKGIEQDEERVRDWYLTVTIRELGGRTAQELVQMGEAGLVMRFLRSIRRGCRD
jgi:hypothetical protein